MEENVNYTPPVMDEEEMEIDWAGYILKLKQHWKFIALVSFAFAVVGVGVALMQKRTYTVSVVLAPEAQGKSGGSLSSITSMLGLGGGAAAGGSDALNITLFPEISQSTTFLTQLFGVEVTPYVSPKALKQGATPAKPTTLYKYITKEDEEPGFFADLMESIFGKAEEVEESDSLNLAQLNGKQRMVVNALKSAVGASVDKKSGMVTIGVTMDDPWIATTLADTVCNRLQQYVIAYRTKKTQEDLDYYQLLADEAKEKMVKAQAAYAQSVDFDRSVILQSVASAKERLQQEAQLSTEIYGQMAQQVEMAKAKLQEEKPVFAVVENATMPAFPNQSRKNTVLAFLLVGFALSAGWKLLGEEYLNRFRTQLQERAEEEKNENA